jgi:hypothetical protein
LSAASGPSITTSTSIGAGCAAAIAFRHCARVSRAARAGMITLTVGAVFSGAGWVRSVDVTQSIVRTVAGWRRIPSVQIGIRIHYVDRRGGGIRVFFSDAVLDRKIGLISLRVDTSRGGKPLCHQDNGSKPSAAVRSREDERLRANFRRAIARKLVRWLGRGSGH